MPAVKTPGRNARKSAPATCIPQPVSSVETLLRCDKKNRRSPSPVRVGTLTDADRARIVAGWQDAAAWVYRMRRTLAWVQSSTGHPSAVQNAVEREAARTADAGEGAAA